MILLFGLDWLCSVRMEQGTVTSLIEGKGTVKGVKYKNKDGEDVKVFAHLTIVCDGCFSNLRKNLCIPQVKFHLMQLYQREVLS